MLESIKTPYDELVAQHKTLFPAEAKVIDLSSISKDLAEGSNATYPT
jgi:hypothetical protein